MVYKTINANVLMNAAAYVPLMEKLKFVEYAAERCFDKMRVKSTVNGIDQDMPPCYKDNTGLKSRYLMGALVRLYLKQDYEPVEGDEWLMAADDYDRWAGGHIFSQIERLKTEGGEIRDKAYQVLNDYKDLERRFNTEIHGLLNIMNDPVTRIMAAMTSQVTPEAFQRTSEELNRLTQEIDAYKSKHKEWKDDGK